MMLVRPIDQKGMDTVHTPGGKPTGRKSTASPAAARTQRYRQRVRAHKVVVGVEIDEQLLGLLIRLHWLQERDAADRAAIAAALARMLADAAAFRDAAR
jgi:hypothetical protein